MARFVKGDVVVIPFPFSDLSATKKRPAVIISDIAGDDFILLQITSQSVKDNYSIPLAPENIIGGSLNKKSNIRPNKIFTLDKNIIIRKIGHLSAEKLAETVSSVVSIIQN